VKQNRQTRVGLGAASLIMILLVLCLVLLGVLSLMSARSDLSLSARHAELAAGYAEASANAQRALAELDALLAEARERTESEEQYTEVCLGIVRTGSADVEWLNTAEAVLRLNAGEERQLDVHIEREGWDEALETRYIVTSYRLVDMKEWNQTEGLILIDM